MFLVWKQWSAQVKENSQKEDVQDGLLDNNDDDFLFNVLELQDDLGVQESDEDVLTQDSLVEVNADVVVHNFQDEQLDSNQICVAMDPENINDDATNNVDINSFEIFVLPTENEQVQFNHLPVSPSEPVIEDEEFVKSIVGVIPEKENQATTSNTSPLKQKLHSETAGKEQN